jgi:hypothetical protein
MNNSIRFLTNSNGIKIPYLTEKEVIWVSATEVARSLNYAKPHGAIKRQVSPI